MTFELTQKEAHALAGFIALIRQRVAGPEWHKAGIEDALAKARVMAPAPDVAVAAIRAAREPSNRTPAVIFLEGPHWRGSDTTPRRPYAADETCAVCGMARSVCETRWPDDHVFESVNAANVRKARQQLDTRRAADALKELAHTDPEPRPVRPKSTKGTEHVAPMRAALAGESA